MTNPHMIAALEAFGATPEMAQLRTQVWELSQRVEDLAAIVAAHLQLDDTEDQPPPAAVALVEYYGACPHGRVLRFGCPECGTATS